MVGYVTTLADKLLENETLREQAASNEQQFEMGDCGECFTDAVIEGQEEAHNAIADKLLKDERIFAAMQGMLAKLVWQQFQKDARA